MLQVSGPSPFRRARVVALLAVLALGAGGAATAVAKPLKRGSRGHRVALVQRALGQASDGIYGPGTKRAVRRFQRRHGLRPADGIVGPATWQALKATGRLGSHHRHRGGGGGRVRSRGGKVTLLQLALGIGADGVFGAQTSRAVRRFQRAHGLTADGMVGPATWAALGHPGIRTVLRRPGGGRHGSGVPGTIFRVIAAGNRIASLPYRFGGGHGSFHDAGYDCSGSVSYALHGGGLLHRPLDSSELMHWGSAGPGRYITVYANPGHAFLVVRGRRFDTTGATAAGTRWQADMRSTAGYVARHPAGM
jgi:Putative peptidoglycan binding domain